MGRFLPLATGRKRPGAVVQYCDIILMPKGSPRESNRPKATKSVGAVTLQNVF